jgi:hypothetical protein
VRFSKRRRCRRLCRLCPGAARLGSMTFRRAPQSSASRRRRRLCCRSAGRRRATGRLRGVNNREQRSSQWNEVVRGRGQFGIFPGAGSPQQRCHPPEPRGLGRDRRPTQERILEPKGADDQPRETAYPETEDDMTHSDVLIIGAGPTGLVLALWLASSTRRRSPARPRVPWRFMRAPSNSTGNSTSPTS